MRIIVKLLNQDYSVKEGVFSYDKTIKPYIASGEDVAILGIKKLSWTDNDKIQVTLDKAEQYIWVQVDETLIPALVYMKEKVWNYTIKRDKRQIDTAFSSPRHCIIVRKASREEVECYRNLAFNSHDQVMETGVYPHVVSNVLAETNPVFLAQNAIDGKLANISHGSYPFGSWGIHGQDDAMLTIEFGRKVKLNMVKLLFRSDHLERLHDSYWQNVTIDFTNGQVMTFETNNSDDLQTLKFTEQITEKIILKDLKKANDGIPFVALSQLEAYGYNILD